MLDLTSIALDTGRFTHVTGTHSQRLTREEFWSLVDAYSAEIERDTRIGSFNLIVARTSLDMMALFVAMIACDRRVSLFPPSSARQDASYYVEQQREAIGRIAPNAILVFEDEGAASLDAVGIGDALVVLRKRSSSVDGDGRRARDAVYAALADPERLLFWQHSSGTTGIKKAVGVTSRMLVGQHASYWPEVARLAGDGGISVASWLPLYHDMGLLATFLMPLLGGSDLAIQDPFDWIEEPASFLEMIAQERSSITWMPNFAYRHFTRLARAMPQCDLSSMRAWVSCSEPVRHADAIDFERTYRERGVRPGSVIGCYAMAETVFAAAQLDQSERRSLRVPVGMRPGERLPPESIVSDAAVSTDGSGGQAIMSSGRIVAGLTAAIIVDGAARTEEGVYGEIALGGPFVFSGYRHMSASESNIRADGLFLTGDLGAIVDGHVFIFGRSKEIIIVNGKNIYAGDIEDHLNLIDGVKPGRVVAFGIDNPRTGSEDLIVVAERRADTAVSAEDLTQTIAASLGRAFLVTPFDVRVVDSQWLVKSTSGKISRASNRTKYLEHF